MGITATRCAGVRWGLLLVAAAGGVVATGAGSAPASTITYVRDGHIVAVSSYTGTSVPAGSSTDPGSVTVGTITGSTGTGTPGTIGGGAGAGGAIGGGATVSTVAFAIGSPGSSAASARRAYDALATRDLPAPTPILTPTRAITGVRSYLRIGGAGAAVFTLLDPLGVGGAIAYDCRAVASTVRWGDGTTTRTASRGAAPRASGSIAHVWTRRGSATVGVTSDWMCRYTFTNGGATGTLALATSGSTTVPVDEVQPVLVR